MGKTTKITVDICLAFTLLLLLITQAGNIAAHEILGLIIILLIAFHLFLNWKWIKGTVKNLLGGKLNKKSRYLLGLTAGLCIAFGVAIVTGVCISQFIFPSDSVNPVISRVHTISAIVGIVLTVLHIKENFGFIKSFFAKKKPAAQRKASD